ncbi:hypothetical protein BH11BAC1_BH11BAC1_07790 [soil metagenome]
MKKYIISMNKNVPMKKPEIEEEPADTTGN